MTEYFSELSNRLFGWDPAFVETVRLIVRDELALIETKRKQDCDHARSGTIDRDGSLWCDDCGKALDEEDLEGPPPDALGASSLGSRRER